MFGRTPLCPAKGRQCERDGFVALGGLLVLRGGSSLAQHPAVRHGEINEKDDGEEKPARGDMKSRDAFREAVISEHNKRSDSNGVTEKHGK